MLIGTLLKPRDKDHFIGESELFIIVEELDILRKDRRTTKKIKGYKVAPCDRLDWGFAVTHNELAQKFEVLP